MKIPFTKPTKLASDYRSLLEKAESGDIYQSIDRVNDYFQSLFPEYSHYFVSSCTHALEMAAYMLPPGGEVIVPDFTFVTSASSFAARDHGLVFCDVNKNDLCLDIRKLEELITRNTRAVVWVDYGGNSSRIQKVRELCDAHNIILIQDAAQSVGAWLTPSANFVGDYICFSYHATKNVTSGGEGGSLLVRENMDNDKARIIFEKGTNRSAFLRGEVDRYRWVELGSSFIGSYTAAALLENQLGFLDDITRERRKIWAQYHEAFLSFASADIIFSSPDNSPNGHIFWMTAEQSNIENFKNLASEFDVQLVSHYQTLQGSLAGQKYSVRKTDVSVSEFASANLLRFPLWHAMQPKDVNPVLCLIEKALG